jgi:hypothetical protein
MRIDKTLQLYVVSQDGVNQMDLADLISAVQGGSKLSSLAIFTDVSEAQDELRRRQLMCKSIEALKGLELAELEMVAAVVAKAAEDMSVERTLKVVEKTLG